MTKTQSIATMVKNRLSLRTPQAQSLQLLHDITSKVDIHTASVETIITVIKQQRSRYEGSDFSFASMCFALATGVGKTRLMGAMIYYLYKAHDIKNFFVVAPNLTIYNKLKEDFRYGNKKYVFKGLADVDGNNPLIIDGDNYLQVNHTMQQGFDFRQSNQFVINIFNIDKFNSKKEKGKFYELSEYIGSSYFEYLKSLGDLVMLMDESHRYRANTSMKSLEALDPVLGLEFTATPFTVSGSKKKDFKNVVYAYNLANAIQDGYVKVPRVATRENFDPNSHSPEELDFVKITDGLQIHERTKAELQVYADNHDLDPVKPFLMISARDQKHADKLEQLIKNDIQGGKYAKKVIKIYSGTGKAFDEAIEKLLEVEKYDNPVEIVIQVMMLKEGWDVNNLYTIVPLRASASEILTEQTIGRGLRLPYGERTGDTIVDRLTVVSHDRYADVINEANKPDSLVRNVINLDDEEQFDAQTNVQKSTPVFLDTEYALRENTVAQEILQNHENAGDLLETMQDIVQKTTIEYISTHTDLTSPQDLQKNEHQKNLQSLIHERISHEVSNDKKEQIQKVRKEIAEEKQKKYVQQGVVNLTDQFIKHTIQVPRVDFDYGESTVHFDTSYKINTQFVVGLLEQQSQIKITNLMNNESERQEAIQQINFTGTVQDYLVSIMMELGDLLYDDYADWMYAIANDIEQKLKETFPQATDEVLMYQIYVYKSFFRSEIGKQIRTPEVKSIIRGEPKVTVRTGVRVIEGSSYTYKDNILDVRDSNFPKKLIKQFLFSGFTRCVEKYAKFDSDTERVFACILEQEERELKWVKPHERYFNIRYYEGTTIHKYVPDFIVETEDTLYMVEPKASNEINDPTVLEKMRSAKLRIDAVNTHGSGKKWKYILLPHDQIHMHSTLDHLVSIGTK